MKIRSKCKISGLLFRLPLIAAAAFGLSLRASAQEDVDTAVFMREARELQEIIVSPGKERYSKKGNPAVELQSRVRAAKDKSDPRLQPHYSYDSYSKTTLALLGYPEHILQKYPFLSAYTDTAAQGQRPILDILLKEKAATTLYEASKSGKETIRGNRAAGVGTSVETGGLETMLDVILPEIDIYDNDIALMGHRFPSPLSAIGPDFYKYYITDTLCVEGIPCTELTFSPRNPQSHSLMGRLYVALADTAGFVKRAEMKVPRTVNLNYADNIYIDQTFELDSLGKRHKTLDEVALDLCLIPGTQPFHARRSTAYGAFSHLPPAQPFSSLQASFDPSMRLIPLSRAEASMGSFMNKLREVTFFRRAEQILTILVGGYIKTGNPSRFDIGPVNTLVSVNSVEGARFRLGGMTTTALSTRIFASGYVAYGTKDHRWKYEGELEYSFLPKKNHRGEFPVNSIKALYRHDVDMIGQHYRFTNADNIFLSLKRRPADLMTYRTQARLEYNLELDCQLSLKAWGEHTEQQATPWLPFTDGAGHSARSFRSTRMGLALRWAPGERYIQRKTQRLEVNPDAPVLIFSHEWGPKGLLGADFTMSRTEFSARKRFRFSAFGSLDAIVKAGIVWSRVPYPELPWPNANLSYTIQPESYSLMNPMEFALDRYAEADLTYWGNGILFNHIPLVKKAKLREAIGFKMLEGALSKRNNPACHPELYRFPADAATRPMGRTPYMEISAGIDNIFTILRVDYVWRLTYRDIPGVDRWGVRVALHFNF